MEMDDGKIRLDFTREKTTLEELHKEQNQYVTRSFQGTFFYEYDDVIYTQKRVLGSKIYIRGKEIPIDDIKEAFQKIKKSFIGITEEKFVYIIIYSRNDLLITHRYDIVPQIFFIGCLQTKNEDKVKFIPSYNFYVPSMISFHGNSITQRHNYKFVRKSVIPENPEKLETNVYIPTPFENVSKISQEDLLEGIVKHTKDFPVSCYDEKTLEIMDFFSNTQNNTQLCVKIFFTESNGEKDRTLIFEKFRCFLPLEKEQEFISLNQKYETFVAKIKNSPRIYNFVNNMGNLVLTLEEDEKDNVHENVKQKVEKTLMLLNKHLRFNLKKDTKESLQTKIKEGIYTFFTYPKNNNNACKILKFSEKINFE